jgi:CheY-like chemotaxis protein
LWTKVKKIWARTFGVEPKASEVTASSLEALARESPELPDELGQLIGQSSALRRLRRVQGVIDGARILWLDDHPEWNSWEIACLEAAGARVRTVETTRAALALVGDGYDVIVSDVDRAGNASEGIAALPLLHEVAPDTPVVLYVGQLQARGVPVGAFGITNRPDELLHLVLDVVERTRS